MRRTGIISQAPLAPITGWSHARAWSLNQSARFWAHDILQHLCASMHATFASYPSSSLVIVNIHHQPGALIWAFRVALLPLTCIHKLLGEPVAVVEVVSAAAPQPVSRQVLGASSAAAPAAGELPLSAGAAHRVHHSCRADGIGECRFSAACKQTNKHTNRNIMAHLMQKEKNSAHPSAPSIVVVYGRIFILYQTWSDIFPLNVEWDVTWQHWLYIEDYTALQTRAACFSSTFLKDGLWFAVIGFQPERRGRPPVTEVLLNKRPPFHPNWKWQ